MLGTFFAYVLSHLIVLPAAASAHAGPEKCGACRDKKKRVRHTLVKNETCPVCVARDIKIKNIEADIVASIHTTDPNHAISIAFNDFLKEEKLGEKYTLSASLANRLGVKIEPAPAPPDGNKFEYEVPPGVFQNEDGMWMSWQEAPKGKLFVDGTLKEVTSYDKQKDSRLYTYKYKTASGTPATSTANVISESMVIPVPEPRKKIVNKGKKERVLPPLTDLRPLAHIFLHYRPDSLQWTHFEEVHVTKIPLCEEKDNQEGYSTIMSSLKNPDSLQKFASHAKLTAQEIQVSIGEAISGEVYISREILFKGRYLPINRPGYVDLVFSRAAHCTGTNTFRTDTVEERCQIHRGGARYSGDDEPDIGNCSDGSVSVTWGTEAGQANLLRGKPPEMAEESFVKSRCPTTRGEWSSRNPAMATWLGANVSPKDMELSVSPDVVDLLKEKYRGTIPKKVMKRFAGVDIHEAERILLGAEKGTKKEKPVEVKEKEKVPETMPEMFAFFSKQISTLSAKLDNVRGHGPEPKREGKKDPKKGKEKAKENPPPKKERRREEKSDDDMSIDKPSSYSEAAKRGAKARPRPGPRKSDSDQNPRTGKGRDDDRQTKKTRPSPNPEKRGRVQKRPQETPIWKDERKVQAAKAAFGTTEFAEIAKIVRSELRSGNTRIDFLKAMKFFKGGKLKPGVEVPPVAQLKFEPRVSQNTA